MAELEIYPDVNSRAASLPCRSGELALQRDMQMMRAGDIAGPAGARTHVERRVAQRPEDGRILALREVVVGAPHHDPPRARTVIARIRKLARQPLQVGENTIAILASYSVYRFRKDLFVVHSDLLFYRRIRHCLVACEDVVQNTEGVKQF